MRVWECQPSLYHSLSMCNVRQTIEGLMIDEGKIHRRVHVCCTSIFRIASPMHMDGSKLQGNGKFTPSTALPVK